MTADELKDLIERLHAAPAPLDDEDVVLLEQAVREYPYFLAPRILLLKSPAGGDNESLRLAVAIEATSDRIMANAALSGRVDFYPPAPAVPVRATEDVIDQFLNTYGNVTPQEEAMLEKMIFNPTPDYSEMLAREEQENLPTDVDVLDPESQEARVNAFILAQHPASRTGGNEVAVPEPEQPNAPVSRPTASDDSSLSESLARIFIKRGRYERAYEIISGLSLKFPKKSAYFADQLRFLQILIKNQRLAGENPAPGRTE